MSLVSKFLNDTFNIPEVNVAGYVTPASQAQEQVAPAVPKYFTIAIGIVIVFVVLLLVFRKR